MTTDPKQNPIVGLGALLALLALLAFGLLLAWNGFVFDVLHIGHRMGFGGALSLEFWMLLVVGVVYLNREVL